MSDGEAVERTEEERLDRLAKLKRRERSGVPRVTPHDVAERAVDHTPRERT